MDIVEFLTARLDEREQLARAATPGPWLVERNEEDSGSLAIKGGPDQIPTVSGNETVAYDPAGWDESARDFAHIAAWDPMFVLAEVAAMRAIVEDCAGAWENGRKFYGDDEGSYNPHSRLALRTLKRLAAPHSTHPNYNPAWALS